MNWELIGPSVPLAAELSLLSTMREQMNAHAMAVMRLIEPIDNVQNAVVVRVPESGEYVAVLIRGDGKSSGSTMVTLHGRT